MGKNNRVVRNVVRSIRFQRECLPGRKEVGWGPEVGGFIDNHIWNADNNGMARRPISQVVRREALTEAGYRCAVPTCRTILAIDLHHLVRVADGGPNTADNLIALCPTCHALHHRGEIPAEAIRVWKGMLVSLNRAFDREAIDNLLFLSLPGLPQTFSADGVLKFTSLIAAGLARARSTLTQSTPTYLFYYAVTLTEKGKMVVEAWKAGDKEALANALAEGAGPRSDYD